MKIAYINSKPDKLTEEQKAISSMYDNDIRRAINKNKKRIAELGLTEAEVIKRIKALNS